MPLGLRNIAHQHLEFYSAVVIWPYKKLSYGQASLGNSNFPTAQMPGRCVQSYMIEGYILLPKESSSGYYGIDRGLFEPLLIESEFEKNIPDKKYTAVSSFYPTGWRKTAYELYESNQINIDDTFGILRDYNTATKIRDLIFPNLGDYDIFFTQTTDHFTDFPNLESCYGYDFAYPGGDYYSAVKNGLFINGSESLNKKYRTHLNKHGLFNDPSLFENYISDFKKEVQSEVNSTFWIYRLIKE